jgi:hypothetical protein
VSRNPEMSMKQANMVAMSTSNHPADTTFSLFELSEALTSVNSSLSVVSSPEYPKSSPSYWSMPTLAIHAVTKSSKKSPKNPSLPSLHAHHNNAEPTTLPVLYICKLEPLDLGHSRKSRFKKWQIKSLLVISPDQ